MVGYPIRETFHWMQYARLVAPDVPREQGDISRDLWAATGGEPPSEEEIANILARRRLREVITRAIIAIPLLADVARSGARHRTEKKMNPGTRQNQFTRSLMAHLEHNPFIPGRILLR